MSAQDAPSLSGVRRALVIRLGGIGDIILTTPMMRLLRSKYPEIRFDVIVQKGFRDAIAGLHYVDHVFEFDKRMNSTLGVRLWQLAMTLRHQHYDMLLNLQPSFKTYVLALVAAASFVLTFRKDRRPQKETGQVRHAIDDFIKELSPLGLNKPIERDLDFCVPEEARQSLNRTLEMMGLDADRKILVINPTASRRINRWPNKNWAALIDYYAAKEHYCVCVIGGAKDKPTVHAVRRLSKHWASIFDLSCRIDLKELGALLERAAVIVTGDTGPMHIAAALETPIVCLSGAADPQRSGPLTQSSTVLIDQSLPCVPCGGKRCKFGKEPKCMSLIDVRQVIQAVARAARPGHDLSLCAEQRLAASTGGAR